MFCYSGFAEQFEELQDSFSLLTRDGVKYGIYFAVTAGTTNAVRYKTQQNFKMMLTMQLNDATDYSMVVGKTDGLIPSKFKGRGLIALDRVYEFQTAHCKETDDMQEFIRNFCNDLAENATNYARPIPVLPKVVTYDYVKPYIMGLNAIPVGVGKKNLNIATVALSNKVVLPIVTQELAEAASFIETFATVMADSANTTVVDTEQILNVTGSESYKCVTENYEAFVEQVFNDMVSRNNDYKDANMDTSVLAKYDEKVFVLIGLKRFVDQLTADGKDKFFTLLDKAEHFYKIRFIIAESVSQWNAYNYDAWYKRHITGTDGLWIGDGVADQYMLKVNKVTSDLYEEVGSEYGYLIMRNRPTLIKLLSSRNEEEVE